MRQTLKALLLTATAVAIAAGIACGSEKVVEVTRVVEKEKVVEKPVEKVVQQTVVVEKEKVVEKQVEKVVRQTVVVEKEKVVEKQVVQTVVVEKVVQVAPPAGPFGTLKVAVDGVASPVFYQRDSIFPTNMAQILWGFQETLARWEAESCLVPNLATNWELSKDQKKVVFTLREGVVFRGSGREWGELTADDVVYSINEAGADNPASKHSQGGETNQIWSPWKAVSKYKVDAPFKTFQGDFIAFTSLSTCGDQVGIVSKKVADELGPDKTRSTPVGTGPFVITQWKPNERIEADAVKNHWRKPPSVEKMIIIEAPEGSVRTAMIRAGEADIAGVPIPDIANLQKEGIVFNEGLRQFLGHFIYFAGNYWLDKIPENGQPVTRTVSADDKHPWIGDPKNPQRMESARLVRHALALAIDREGISKTLLGGFGGPIYRGGTGVSLHQSSTEWKDKWKIEFDPKKAKELLTQAGYPNGFKVDDLYCPVSIGISAEVCQAVAGMWKEVGVSAQVTTAAYTSRRPTMVGRTIDVPWFAPWGPNRVSARTDPGGTCGCRLFPEPTGGYNPGLEIPGHYEYFKLTASQIQASPENLKTREQIEDEAFRDMLGAGVVEVPTLIAVSPKRVASWELQPLRLINNFESVVLKR